MNNTQEVFKRYEKKYLLTQAQFTALTPALKKYMQIDQYGKHTICNIYFDTPTFELIRTSIEGPVYKEKLRLRSYGIPKPGDIVFIELKKKFDGIVYKRRIPMELTNAYAYLYRHEHPHMESQILSELDWVLEQYQLNPAAALSYDRVALFGIEDSELRMTFDFNIRGRDHFLELERGPYGKPILEQQDILMEIKIADAMPLWMSHVLSELHIFPCSFSKYGSYYKQYLIKDSFIKGGIYCA